MKTSSLIWCDASSRSPSVARCATCQKLGILRSLNRRLKERAESRYMWKRFAHGLTNPPTQARSAHQAWQLYSSSAALPHRVRGGLHMCPVDGRPLPTYVPNLDESVSDPMRQRTIFAQIEHYSFRPKFPVQY